MTKVSSARAAEPAGDRSEPNSVATLPVVNVTAQKIPQDATVVPVSVTAVPRMTLRDADVRNVEEAGIYSSNLYFTDIAPRKNSAPRLGPTAVREGIAESARA